MEDLRNFVLLAAVGVDAIELQEKEGQRSFATSETLPKNADWQTLESWGVQRLGDVPDDELFCFCKLPEGWSKRPFGDTDYWTHLIDASGNTRASIFYKAAFYDRDAFLVIE